MAIARVLVIEDEEDIASFIERGLVLKGYDVDVASTGSEGLDILRDRPPDIVLLDLMLPGVDGVEVCRRLRAVSDVPVIMLTALDSVKDKVKGLEAGADDYITKPFSFMELMARVEAVLRRCTGYDGRPETYRFGDVHVDFKRMETRKGHKKLAMSHREFDLLRFLIEHRGEVLPRERILSSVWGYENGSFTRTVDMHVAKLRKKIEDRPANPAHIVTVHRVGYKFAG